MKTSRRDAIARENLANTIEIARQLTAKNNEISQLRDTVEDLLGVVDTEVTKTLIQRRSRDHGYYLRMCRSSENAHAVLKRLDK